MVEGHTELSSWYSISSYTSSTKWWKWFCGIRFGSVPNRSIIDGLLVHFCCLCIPHSLRATMLSQLMRLTRVSSDLKHELASLSIGLALGETLNIYERMLPLPRSSAIKCKRTSLFKSSTRNTIPANLYIVWRKRISCYCWVQKRLTRCHLHREIHNHSKAHLCLKGTNFSTGT